MSVFDWHGSREEMLEEAIKHQRELSKKSFTEEQLDKMLNSCHEDGGECMFCSVFWCPDNEPLHLHHDGCPACTPEDK